MRETIDLTLNRDFNKYKNTANKGSSIFNEGLIISTRRLLSGVKQNYPWRDNNCTSYLKSNSFFMIGTKADRANRRYVESFCAIDGVCDCCGKNEKKKWLVSSSLCSMCEERVKGKNRNPFEKYTGML